MDANIVTPAKFDDFDTPRINLKAMGEPKKYKKPSVIFVCPFADLFGEWVDRLWIQAVIDVVRENHIHQFAFLTKNPKGIMSFNSRKMFILVQQLNHPKRCSGQRQWKD